MIAHLTPGESATLFAEIGNMQPSRSSLDRVAKELSVHWESQRTAWEAHVCRQARVPVTAAVVALSVDGVMAPLRGENQPQKSTQPGKHASGPTSYKEVGCGTVTLYDQDTERLQTIRYGRMPERKKATLQAQLETEVARVLALRPELFRVHLADRAKDNWRLLHDNEAHLPAPPQPPVEILDFYHACDHLKQGCDAAWGESTVQSKAQFEKLKTLLKAAENGAERIIRSLRYQHNKARGTKRTRLSRELTYFRNQRHRMHYAEYIRGHLPIASGVMEASCKTLVTQRLKRSGMAWTVPGGQAVLTLRSLIQSDRWQPAWALLRADFCQEVKVRKECSQPQLTPSTPPLALVQPAELFRQDSYATLPLAA